MKDRLRELIKDGKEKCTNADCGLCGLAKFGGFPDCRDKFLANYLLENGVIVPPCKVGDMAYFIVEDKMEEDKKYITSQRINDVSTRGIYLSTSIVEENCNDFEPYSEFGKTVFLTREEAEQALKGENKNESI